MNVQITKPYEKYLIVWMDILGFTDEIMGFSHDEAKINSIAKMMELVDSLASLYSKDIEGNPQVKANVFSDSILVTCKEPNLAGLDLSMIVVASYQITLAARGYFVRGAAAIGGFFLNGNTAFGPAFIQALGMEKFAIWPRVLIAPDLMSKIDPFSESELHKIADSAKIPSNKIQEIHKVATSQWLDDNTCQDSNGLLYLDYLRTGFRTLAPAKWLMEFGVFSTEVKETVELNLLLTHRDAIVQAVQSDKVANNIKILSRYHRLATYHNDFIDKAQKDSGALIEDIILFSRGFLGEFFKSEDDKNKYFEAKEKELENKIDGFRYYKVELPKVFPQLYVGRYQE